jgi:hypothetical protein
MKGKEKEMQRHIYCNKHKELDVKPTFYCGAETEKIIPPQLLVFISKTLNSFWCLPKPLTDWKGSTPKFVYEEALEPNL